MTNLKQSFQGVVNWAKKNPAIAALLIGGVALLAFSTIKSGKTSSGAELGDGGGLSTDDAFGGLGSGFLIPPTTPLSLGDFIPETITEPKSGGGVLKSVVTTIPAGTIFPSEDEDEKDFYLLRSQELEEIAGSLPIGDQSRGLLADAARWYGIASLSDEQQNIYMGRAPAWQPQTVTKPRTERADPARPRITLRDKLQETRTPSTSAPTRERSEPARQRAIRTPATSQERMRARTRRPVLSSPLPSSSGVGH